jgi:hypothetical protein
MLPLEYAYTEGGVLAVWEEGSSTALSSVKLSHLIIEPATNQQPGSTLHSQKRQGQQW